MMMTMMMMINNNLIGRQFMEWEPIEWSVVKKNNGGQPRPGVDLATHCHISLRGKGAKKTFLLDQLRCQHMKPLHLSLK